MDMDQRNRQMEADDLGFIWHPFTQMKDYMKEKPLIIEKGNGVYLWDIYGNKYIDGISSLWVTTHGHGRREIDEAIIEQIGKISHSTLLGLSHPSAIVLARNLANVAPEGLSKVFYSDNGSCAVEIGLKMAFQYWLQSSKGKNSKKKIISFTNAYHGDTLGAVSVGGIDLFHEIYSPLLFESIKAPSPYCYRCHLGKTYPACRLECLGRLEEVVSEHHEQTAALIIEPLVQGAAGMLVSPPGYLKGVRALCSKYGILMIADEVAVGFGRTGRLFACEHEQVIPDILILGKGITGGYLPLAVTMATEEIFNGFLGEFDELKTFYHGHTYTGNPLACAAAIASLDLFRNDRTLERMMENIERLRQGLRRFRDLKHVGDVRQMGFMVGIELVSDKDTKTPFPAGEKTGIKVILEARKRGLILRPLGDVIVLMPILNTDAGALDALIRITYEAIQTVTEA
ncbi:MAG: adenosylmethionine--8-amino-7-oxononanoate transaminase [Desulfobacterales bacterium]|nr:adenosylmethionine--8-amino-7-oxononanoate transaminase [Desulfobacterales bacterium]